MKRLIAIATGVGSSLVLSFTQVHAQSDANKREAVELDRITVTGSRIKRTDLESVSPVVTITREEMVESGHNTLQDYIRTLSITQLNNGDDFANSFANGTSTINLRGLGGNATLVLLNGRRISPYGQGQNISEAFVDLNSIPFSAIERIEILKDGASAIYGADAVAGVVNIILRSDFVGAEYNVGYQSDSEGDAPQYSGGVIFGGGNNQTHWTTIFCYLNREALFLRDREVSKSADLSRFGSRDFRSPFSYPGTIADPTLFAFYPAPGCGELPGTPYDSGPSGVFCRFNYNDFINTYPKSERFSFLNFLDHEISPNVNLYWDFLINYNNIRNISAPAPYIGPYTGTLEELPESVVNDPLLFGLALLSGQALYFPATNPYNPLGHDVGLAHRALSMGPRTQDINGHQVWSNAGIEGAIGDSLWDYDVGFAYSQSKVLNENRNAQNAVMLQRYFIGTPDPSGSGEMLYYDPFSATQDERVFDAINVTYENRNQFDELNFYGTVTGPLFEFGGREIGMAAGIEYREQDMSQEADPLRNAGSLVGTGRATDSHGSRDQTSVFAELSIPLGPLEIQLAARYENYSDFGSTTKPKVAFKWTVADQLLLRASYGESFRAPSLFQMFTGATSSFGEPGPPDPHRCVDPNAGPGENGNAPDLDPAECDNPQYYAVDNISNPDLQPEESESWNLGLVWAPSEDLYFQLDFWSFEYDDIIVRLPFTTVLNLNNPRFVIRSSPVNGLIQKVLLTYINGALLEMSGIDFYFQWQFEALGGLWTLGNETTWYDAYEYTDSDGNVYKGVGGRVLGTFPEIKSNFTASYARGNHTIQGIVHYRSGIENHPFSMVGTPEERCTPQFVNTLTEDCDTDDYATLDLSYMYDFTGVDASLQVGCLNCTDEDPPFDGLNWLGFFTSLDDPRGLVLFGRWTHRF